jgi:hypothetical protein
MDKKIFENLQNHVFDKDNPWPIWADGSKKPNRLPYFSSWAVYGKNDLENKEVIEDNVIHSLNGGIVFVGLNFSRLLWSSWGPWQNIHGNYNVRWLLDGENESFNAEKAQKYKGAYITDIIKNHIGSMAAKVMGQLDQEKIKKNIGWFFDEIDMLGADAIEMHLFGKDVEYLFRNYVMQHKEFPRFRQKVKKCQRIEHYAGSNNGRFRKFAPQQLGLVALSEQDVLHILWNDLEEKNNARRG